MNLESLPDGLPAGRLIVPDPSHAGGAPASEPVMWVSDAPIANPAEWWVRQHAMHAGSGLWPLVLETLSGAPARPWHDGELGPPGAAAPTGVDQLLERLWSSGDPDEQGEILSPFERWPGLAGAGAVRESPDAVACQFVRATFAEHSLVGLVPAPSGADALAACGWLGSCNYAEVEDIAAVLRSWQDRFGARLVSVGFDTIVLSVAAPPLSADHALHVAAEHFAFCPDNVWQGEFDTLREYAEALVDSDCWWFWWD